MNKQRIVLALGIIVIISLGVILFYKPSKAPESGNTVAPSEQAAAPATGSQSTTAPATKSGGTSKPAATAVSYAPSGVKFISPTEGNIWALNTNHAIALNREPGAAGQLYLMDASTKKQVGWIIPYTTDKQMAVTWDTRDISINRIGGQRTDLAPGTYYMRWVLDNRTEISSPTFHIAAAGSPDITVAIVRLKNYSISPSDLTVYKGTNIVFVNGDAKAQTISGQGLPTFTVAGNGGTYTLKTASLAVGIYNYLSDVYTYRAQGTINVK